jgi:hypothetical protein
MASHDSVRYLLAAGTLPRTARRLPARTPWIKKAGLNRRKSTRCCGSPQHIPISDLYGKILALPATAAAGAGAHPATPAYTFR